MVGIKVTRQANTTSAISPEIFMYMKYIYLLLISISVTIFISICIMRIWHSVEVRQSQESVNWNHQTLVAEVPPTHLYIKTNGLSSALSSNNLNKFLIPHELRWNIKILIYLFGPIQEIKISFYSLMFLILY